MPFAAATATAAATTSNRASNTPPLSPVASISLVPSKLSAAAGISSFFTQCCGKRKANRRKYDVSVLKKYFLNKIKKNVFFQDDGRGGTGNDDLDEEEMTALNIARDLDRMEREQENAGSHSIGDQFEQENNNNSSMPNNSNNNSSLMNPGLRNSSQKSSLGQQGPRKASNGGSGSGSKISVEPIVHVVAAPTSAANSSNINNTDAKSDAASASTSSSVKSERRGPSAPSPTNKALANETNPTSGGPDDPVAGTSAGSGILGSAHHGSPQSTTSNSGSIEAHVVRISNI